MKAWNLLCLLAALAVSATPAMGASLYPHLPDHAIAPGLLVPNDDIDDAVPLAVRPFDWAQPTTGATLQFGEPRPCGNIAATAWFEYTPLTSGYLTIDTMGSTYDTVLALYTGSTFAPSALACNDDDPAFGLASRLTHFVDAGRTYYVQAGGYHGQQGTLVLRANSDVGLA